MSSQSHLKELIFEHAPPPPAIAESAIASLVRMGFPERCSEESVALCACHKEVKVGVCYTCPQCKARVCELPTKCNICDLTLVSSPHLARSYHHLFPIQAFEEISLVGVSKLPRVCFGCQQDLPYAGKIIYLQNVHYIKSYDIIHVFKSQSQNVYIELRRTISDEDNPFDFWCYRR